MRGHIVLYLLAVLLFAPPAAAQDNAAPTNVRTGPKLFNASETTLENGLRVVVIPNHRAPVVTHMAWYRVGAADEAHGKSGIAHFLEHLMFKGSEGLAPGEFSERVRALGGRDNAFTGADYTAYFQSVAAEHLETVMKMEAGRMRGMTLPEGEVDSERLVILEERRQRTDNNPGARLTEQMMSALYPNHPYGTPIIGWMHEMEGLTREDAKAFYDRWYGPNNAILVVAGDVKPETVFALAQTIYGPVARVDVPPRVRTARPPMAGQTEITLRDPLVRETEVQMIFRVPSFAGNAGESLALQLLEEIMGGGPTSRLYKALVVEQKIASSAGLSYRPDMLGEANLWVYASPLPGQDPRAVRSALETELRRLAREGVSAQELADAGKRLQSAAIYALDSLTGPAMVIGTGLATGADMDAIEYWPQDIAAVSAENILAAARKYIDPDNYGLNPPVVGYLLPPETEAKPAAPANPEAEAQP